MVQALRPLEELFENKPQLGYVGFSHVNTSLCQVNVVSGVRVFPHLHVTLAA
jgi:hypothetical protein